MDGFKKQHRHWPKADIYELITEYQSTPCLWDPDDPGYKDKRKRAQALHNLGVGFQTTAAEVKRKIHNLRSQMLQEMKKIEVRGVSNNPDDPYSTTSPWPYFELMCATVPDLERRPFYKKMGGVNQRNPSTTGGEASEAEDSGAQDTTTSSSGWQGGSHVGPSDNDEEVADTAASRDPLAPNHTVPNYVYVDVDSDEGELEDRKPKRMRAFEEPEASAVSSRALIHEGPKVSVTQDQKDTEFEAFGRSVAAQLKNMPFHVALKLQLKIQTLITEERLKIMSGSAN